MLVCTANKLDFMDDVRSNVIESRILDAFKRHLGHSSSESEIASWSNSMMYMSQILADGGIPNDAGVAIEYKLPQTSRRIDFILTGRGENMGNAAIIIELKQWTKAKATFGKTQHARDEKLRHAKEAGPGQHDRVRRPRSVQKEDHYEVAKQNRDGEHLPGTTGLHFAVDNRGEYTRKPGSQGGYSAASRRKNSRGHQGQLAGQQLRRHRGLGRHSPKRLSFVTVT